MPANANHFAYTKGETTILLYGQGPVELHVREPVRTIPARRLVDEPQVNSGLQREAKLRSGTDVAFIRTVGHGRVAADDSSDSRGRARIMSRWRRNRRQLPRN